jgi:hypothetical protein
MTAFPAGIYREHRLPGAPPATLHLKSRAPMLPPGDIEEAIGLPAHNALQTLELGVWRAAHLTIENHGARAEREAIRQTIQMLRQGDRAGSYAWKRISTAIIILLIAAPTAVRIGDDEAENALNRPQAYLV